MAKVWHIDTTERSSAIKKEGTTVTHHVDGYRGHHADSEGPMLYASILYHGLEMTRLQIWLRGVKDRDKGTWEWVWQEGAL